MLSGLTPRGAPPIRGSEVYSEVIDLLQPNAICETNLKGIYGRNHHDAHGTFLQNDTHNFPIICFNDVCYTRSITSVIASPFKQTKNNI